VAQAQHGSALTERASLREQDASPWDDRAGDSPATAEDAVLGLQRLAGNQAVVDLLATGGDPADAGPEAVHLVRASGVAHPALQRAAAAIRERRGLFGSVQRAGPPGGGSAPPVFGSESAHAILRAGSVAAQKHAEFPAKMGQTMYVHNDIGVWPSFGVTYKTPWNHWFSDTATPKPTTAQSATWWAIATPANEEGYKMPDELPAYPGYEYYIKVSSAAAAIIKRAEEQHVNDLDQGWAITGAATATAINEASVEEPEVRPSKPAAKDAAVAKVAAKLGPVGEKIKGGLRSGGRLESSLGPLMDSSSTLSTEFRDKGKHTIPVRFVEKDETRKRVVFDVDDSFHLDETPSATVVNPGNVG
jgi:hypothetical protein